MIASLDYDEGECAVTLELTTRAVLHAAECTLIHGAAWLDSWLTTLRDLVIERVALDRRTGQRPELPRNATLAARMVRAAADATLANGGSRWLDGYLTSLRELITARVATATH